MTPKPENWREEIEALWQAFEMCKLRDLALRLAESSEAYKETAAQYAIMGSRLEKERDQLAEQVERLKAERCRHGWRGRPPKDGQRIVTPCPSCRSESLFIGDGGHLTCASVPTSHGGYEGCKNPSLQDQIEVLIKERDEARRERDEARHEAQVFKIQLLSGRKP